MTTPNNSVWLVIYENVIEVFTTEAKARKYKAVYYDNDSFVEVVKYRLDTDPYIDKEFRDADMAMWKDQRQQREIDEFKSKHPELSIEPKVDVK